MPKSSYDARLEPRFVPRGRTFVYILPCVGEDLLKVGFSQNPAQRFQTLHANFYAYFDLERGMLIETDQLREARRIERLFIERWPENQAPAPLVVSETAGGHTEWFRGIHADVSDFGYRLAQRYGHVVHAPLRLWLRDHFAEKADQFFSWSISLLDFIEQQSLHASTDAQDPGYGKALRDELNMYERLGFDLSSLVPTRVLDWRWSDSFQ